MIRSLTACSGLIPSCEAIVMMILATHSGTSVESDMVTSSFPAPPCLSVLWRRVQQVLRTPRCEIRRSHCRGSETQLLLVDGSPPGPSIVPTRVRPHGTIDRLPKVYLWEPQGLAHE